MEEAKALLQRSSRFEYLKGRVMKVDLSGDEFEARLYDRDNGANAAQQVIDSLRSTKDANSVLIRAQHASATSASAQETLKHLSDETTVVDDGDGTPEFHLGLDDMADKLRPKIEQARRSIKSPLE